MPPPLPSHSLHPFIPPRSHLAFASFLSLPLPFPPADLGGCQLIHAFFFCLAFDKWIVGKEAISAPSEVRRMLVLYIPEEVLGGGGGAAAGIGDDGGGGGDDER